jgi:hypothetical protein
MVAFVLRGRLAGNPPSMSAAALRLGAPVRSRVSAKGTLELWRPLPGLLVSRVTGYLGLEGAREIESIFRKQVAEDGRHLGFHDWHEMSDYDSDARVLLTHVVYELLSQVRGVHFLVQSRVVAFGVQAANLVLRRLMVHPSEASFDRELLRVLGDAGSIPPPSVPRP